MHPLNTTGRAKFAFHVLIAGDAEPSPCNTFALPFGLPSVRLRTFATLFPTFTHVKVTAVVTGQYTKVFLSFVNALTRTRAVPSGVAMPGRFNSRRRDAWGFAIATAVRSNLRKYKTHNQSLSYP